MTKSCYEIVLRKTATKNCYEKLPVPQNSPGPLEPVDRAYSGARGLSECAAALRASLPWPREKSWRRCPSIVFRRILWVGRRCFPLRRVLHVLGACVPRARSTRSRKYRVTSLNFSDGRLKRHQRCVANSGTHELMGPRR